MASAHVIEVGEITAGIVVLEHGGFRFFASERAFSSLEGAVFRTTDHAVRAARERLRSRKMPGRAPLIRSPAD
jgi:transposase